MVALKNMPISFPGLFGEWELNIPAIAIPFGNSGRGIYWYGIILALGVLAGMYIALKQKEHYGLTEDHITDIVLWAVPSCIVGARLYYVIFYLDRYRNIDGTLNWGEMIAVWDGGIAIYGAVIAAVIVLAVYTHKKGIPMGAATDLGAMGLLLGQIIGRWANFINREAFGASTTLPWRMRLWISSHEYVEVHPTFFYESLWNLVGLLLIIFVISKGRRFDGENTWFYFLWYGLGRAWIEGLRADSLYLFDWTFMGERIRVSQALSLTMVLVTVSMLIYNISIRKRRPEDLYVNQLARMAAEEMVAEESAENADALAVDGADEASTMEVEEAPAKEPDETEEVFGEETLELEEENCGDQN